MRTVFLIAAGLASFVGAAPSARAQYYGYPPYLPYYAYPYAYYPPAYYPPPPVIYMPRPVYRPPVVARRRVIHPVYHPVKRPPIYRSSRRKLINPLLGPLLGPRPGAQRRYRSPISFSPTTASPLTPRQSC